MNKDGDEFEVSLPHQRLVRSEDYSSAGSYLREGREWAESSPDLVELARSDLGFRLSVVGHMRNCAWFIRNHKTVAAETVLKNIRKYMADAALLELAGVHPVIVSMYGEMWLSSCGCKHTCGAMEIDPLNPPARWECCDRVVNDMRRTMATMMSPQYLRLIDALPPSGGA